MSSKTYRGVVKNKTIVLLDPTEELAEGTEVLVTLMPKPADIAALLEELRANPVDKEAMEEFNRILEEAFPINYLKPKTERVQQKDES
jgi:hypothetical protein